MHPFICALPACFCLPPDVPPPPPLSVSLLLFFLSTEQRHVDMRPACTATREQVSGAFDQLQDQTCPPLPRVHSSDWSCSIMGRHRQPKMHTHTHVLSVDRITMSTHTQRHTYKHTRYKCWLCSQWGGLFAGHEGVRERWCVWFTLSCPLFLPLTVRWMIAITGAISETEWRSMGQWDTAMGNQPSDYCTALPWEHCAVYLSGGLLFHMHFPLSFTFPLCGLLMCRAGKSICLFKPVQMWLIS